MKLLDDDKMEQLQEFETAMRYAVKSNFVNMKSSDFQRFAKIYGEIFEPLTPKKMSCNTCRLNSLKLLGNAYFDTKAYNESQKKEKEEEVKSEEPAKRKPGRPKKLDI